MKQLNYMNTLVEKICKEREQFKQDYMNKSPKEVYGDWYRIGFYEAYYELFTSEFYGDENIYKWLCSFKNPLSFLYDEWLGSDGAFDHNWDAMWDWIKLIYEEEQLWN